MVKGVWGKPALGSGEAFFEVTNDNEIAEAVLRSSNQITMGLTSLDSENGIYEDFNWDYLEMRVTYDQDNQGENLPELECGDGVVSVHLGEQCDDGNTITDDYCSNDCQNWFLW